MSNVGIIPQISGTMPQLWVLVSFVEEVEAAEVKNAQVFTGEKPSSWNHWGDFNQRQRNQDGDGGTTVYLRRSGTREYRLTVGILNKSTSSSTSQPAVSSGNCSLCQWGVYPVIKLRAERYDIKSFISMQEARKTNQDSCA